LQHLLVYLVVEEGGKTNWHKDGNYHQ